LTVKTNGYRLLSDTFLLYYIDFDWLYTCVHRLSALME